MTWTRLMLSAIEGIGCVTAINLAQAGYDGFGLLLVILIVGLAYTEGFFRWGQ